MQTRSGLQQRGLTFVPPSPCCRVATLFVVGEAIPAPKQIGVSDQAIRTVTVEVPGRFFETGVYAGVTNGGHFVSRSDRSGEEIGQRIASAGSFHIRPDS